MFAAHWMALDFLHLLVIAQTQFRHLGLLFLVTALGLSESSFRVALRLAGFIDLPEHVVLCCFQPLGSGTEFVLEGQVTLGKTSVKFDSLLLLGRDRCFLLTHGFGTQTGDFLLQRVDLAKGIVFGCTLANFAQPPKM